MVLSSAVDKSIRYHIIATRPNNRATNLVKGLSELPDAASILQVSHCPLIRIANYDDPEFQQNCLESKRFDGVIFISGNAVDLAKRQLSSQNWQALISNPLFAIGEQTAMVLQSEVDKFNIENGNQNKSRVRYPSEMNSEGLLNLPELKDCDGQSWLIVKGLGGRERLKQGLLAAGAEVDELCVYQRKLPDLVAQKEIATYNQKNTIWLVTSLEALNNLSRILQPQVNDCKVIVSSDRIAQQAKLKNFDLVAQSEDATDKQLINCVKRLLIV